LAWTGSGALPHGRDRTSVGFEKDGAALPPMIAAPRVDTGGCALSLRTVVCETTGLEDYGAQLGDAAATSIVEVNKRKTGPGHRILQKREHRRRRQAMLAAQMQKSTNNAVPFPSS
jgi:hypothetical protein